MKILVTGGMGFVGSHLIRELLEKKENEVCALVRNLDKLQTCAFKDNITVIRGDLFKTEAFPEDIELVFHLAALTKVISPKEFMDTNYAGTLSLMEKLKPLKKLNKVVLLSSLAAAGPNRQGTPMREEMPAEPISLYGKSKLAQEKIFAEHCPVPYVTVRAPIVFGPGDMDMLAAFRIARSGILPLLGKMERRYSVIYVKDLVHGMIVAANSRCQNEIFYIANPDPVEWRNFMEQIALLLGRKKTRKIMIPQAMGRIMAEFSEIRIRASGKKAIFNRDKFSEMKFSAWICSPEKIRSLLHFQPRFPLQTALEETIGWYKEQKLL
jgi:dihydroflavonol-4-reductase